MLKKQSTNLLNLQSESSKELQISDKNDINLNLIRSNTVLFIKKLLKIPHLILTHSSLIKFEERKIKVGYLQSQMNRTCQIINLHYHQLIDIHLSKLEIEPIRNLKQKCRSKLEDLKIKFERSCCNFEPNVQMKRKPVNKLFLT